MTRRNFIALISLCVLVTLGVIVVGVGLFATQSDIGQTAMRKWVEGRVRSSIAGKVYIGKISGSFLTGITIDSLDLRDEEDSLVIATGRIALEYDPRDLVDRRLYFRKVDIAHPAVVLRQHENWKWNYRKLFRLGRPQRPASSPERGFGDFVILDSVHIGQGASFRVTIPWHPDDSLHGARRDSAIRANVARNDHEIRHTREGITQTYRWTNAYAAASHIRIADPDSAGLAFVIDSLHALESTPPFKWRNITGVGRVLGDSAWVDSAHFDLAASTGTAKGKIWWGSDLPVRYDVHIVGDSISLADVAWVYPTLPTTGGGKAKLDIRNERNPQLLDYAVRDMDVRTTKSHLLGNITFEIGGPVLAVHDVKMQADRADFDLLRTLNGKPFPADWQGKITGTVTARGGPLTHFYVDAANLRFDDAHVPGAISHLQGHGELDILFPAFTAFHSFAVSTDHFDIRTLPAIYPAFPRIKGILSGTAVLDSSWLDVRVSNANLTHTDGAAEPTHATGGGRITYGVQFMAYDLNLQASPLSLTTLAESYPKLPLRGAFSGPVRVRGIAPDLDVTADLTGPAGHLTYAGKVDADSLGGYGGKGSGTFDGFDMSLALGLSGPKAKLDGAFTANLLGDSLANLAGSLDLRLDRSSVDRLAISSGTSRVRFADGLLMVDTAEIHSTAGVASAHGVIGLTRSPPGDSLAFSIVADSLGGLRPYITAARGNIAVPAIPDSLLGRVVVAGAVHGWLDSLAVKAQVRASELSVSSVHTDSATATVAIQDVRKAITGDLSAHANAVVAGGVHLDTASVATTVLDAHHLLFAAGARTSGGAQLRTSGDYRSTGDTMAVRVDTLSLALGASRWTLQRPSYFATSAAAVTIDTLLLANEHGGRVSGFVNAPQSLEARGALEADSIALVDMGQLVQLPSALTGVLSFNLRVSGTRDLPTLALNARAQKLAYADISTELISVEGAYAANRANLQANVLKSGRSILDATVSYPVALTLFSAEATGDSLRGRFHADSIELAILEALSPKVKNAAGRLSFDFALSGAPSHPHVGGQAAMRNGAIEVPSAGVRFANMEGAVTVDPVRDSLTINRFRWTSPASGGSASVQGSLVFRDLNDLHMDLRLDANSLRAVDKRGLARLDVSTGASGLTLRGGADAATLSGDVDVVRGTIYIPDLVRKQVVDLTPEDFAQLFDTTDVRNRSLMPQPPSALVEHLRLDGVSIRLGEDVWLRSREASIKLGGSLNVTRARDERETTRSTLARTATGDSARYKLALSGSLSADRGTYTLDLTAVQREFQVESGRITFFGTSDFNPEIDVSARYQLKQANRADIGIRARIHGNFYPQPALELSSTDAYLSPSDLVAYLVTGQPSSELSRQDLSASQRAFEFVLPTVGASVSRALREQLGGVVDLIQIQSGAVNEQVAGSTSSSSQFRSILSSTRLGGEKQISSKLFLSFSTGLCQLGGTSEESAQQGLVGFANAIEGKLEYRFPVLSPDRLSIRAGREPPASALRCGTESVRGFVATPQQWGFSLFRSWSF